MTINERTTRDVGSINADLIGKVFVVRSPGLRECLVPDCANVLSAVSYSPEPRLVRTPK